MARCAESPAIHRKKKKNKKDNKKVPSIFLKGNNKKVQQ
jgi:hypothetical protein